RRPGRRPRRGRRRRRRPGRPRAAHPRTDRRRDPRRTRRAGRDRARRASRPQGGLMKDLSRREPMETKVKAASLASAVGSFVVALLVLKVPALAGAADLIQAAVVGAVTTLGTAA